MNIEKAREYFSSYYEGRLDNGLLQSFERAISQDAQIQAEYNAFEQTMQQLNTLRHMEVEPPYDLHEIISARVDRHIYETKIASKAGWVTRWKTLTVGGVAVLALVSAILALLPSNDKGPYASSFGINSSQTVLVSSESGFTLNYIAPSQLEVTIRQGVHGKSIETFRLSKYDRLNIPILNTNDKAEFFTAEFSNGIPPIQMAIPGKKPVKGAEGAGTLVDLAKALADQFQIPVELIAKNTDFYVRWSFHSTDPVGTKLDSSAISIDQRNSNLIRVFQNQ